jgi:hypothetical protein
VVVYGREREREREESVKYYAHVVRFYIILFWDYRNTEKVQHCTALGVGWPDYWMVIGKCTKSCRLSQSNHVTQLSVQKKVKYST